ncbi:MAG TPA: T9SS type A sorting domain-containing protein, partial [Bacteroidales bacterium]
GTDTVWAVTTGGDILATANASGDTVHFTVDKLSDAWLTEIFATDGSHAWAIGNNGSLYRYGVLEGFPSGDANIIDIAVDQQIQPAEIDLDAQTVQVIVLAGTDLSQIIPEIYLSPDATVNPPGGTMQDFTNPIIYTVTSGNGQTEKDWTVTVSIATGDIENKDPEIRIYPNPGKGKFRIMGLESGLKINRVEIIDAFGKILQSFSGKNITEGTEFDSGNLTPGLYFCRFYTENQIFTKKIIIQK